MSTDSMSVQTTLTTLCIAPACLDVIELVQGDRLPTLPFQFFQLDGKTPIDITGKVATLRLRLVGQPRAHNLPGTLSHTDDVNGKASYTFTSTDLVTPGELEGELTLDGMIVYDLLRFSVVRKFVAF